MSETENENVEETTTEEPTEPTAEVEETDAVEIRKALPAGVDGDGPV